MFHKFALSLNCVLIALSCVLYYLTPVLSLLRQFGILILQTQFVLTNIFMCFSLLILAIVFSFLFILVTSLVTDIKVGKPPINSSVIAYKYGLSDTVTGSDILTDKVHFPHCDKIHICYERKGSLFGIAHGAIIGDQVSSLENVKEHLAQQGYNIFQTMSASNAVYISCPTLPWLSYFGIWLALCIIYPRFYKYSKIHRLSAYPVVELYRRFSVVLMAPLSQQDLFLVPEAESLLNRSCSGTNSTLSSTTNLSCSPLKNARSRTVDSVGSTTIENNNVTKPKLIHTSTPIHSNGNTKKS